jgi:hypothetical protein
MPNTVYGFNNKQDAINARDVGRRYATQPLTQNIRPARRHRGGGSGDEVITPNLYTTAVSEKEDDVFIPKAVVTEGTIKLGTKTFFVVPDTEVVLLTGDNVVYFEVDMVNIIATLKSESGTELPVDDADKDYIARAKIFVSGNPVDGYAFSFSGLYHGNVTDSGRLF